MIIKTNEIRRRITEDSTMYVLGTAVRQQLLGIATALQHQQRPDRFNKYDEDALYSMVQWLEEERDFSKKQWRKFGKMLNKYNLPSSIYEMAKAAEWTIGEELSNLDMYKIMEGRREAARQRKLDNE